MEIKNLINQYYSSVNNNSSQATKPQGVEQLTGALSAIKAGTVFEGTVNSIKGSTVLLGLSSGQNITARLLADLDLSIGESVFFQVMKNDGQEISIKPVSVGASLGNPIISDALKSASLPVTDQTIAMVDEMIKNHLPIDSKSIQEMSHLVFSVPSADPRTAVVLKSLGLPADKTMLSMVKNVREGGELISDSISALSDSACQIIAEEPGQFDGIADIITDIYLDGDRSLSEGILAKEPVVNNEPLTDEGFNEPVSVADLKGEEKAPAAVESHIDMNRSDYPEGAVGNTMTPSDFKRLSDFLASDRTMRETFPGLFDSKGGLDPKALTKDVFLAVKWLFDSRGSSFTAAHLRSGGVSELIKGIISDRYALSPDRVADKAEVSRLFDRIEKDMEEVARAAQTRLPEEAGQRLTQASEGARGNAAFVKEVNTVYNYIQIPLKLSGANATGELYIYSDKRKKKWDPDEPVSAFLHFDLENLGSTDISVRLLGKKLDTKFSLSDRISYSLIENNIDLLKERLESMGYSCSLSVSGSEPKRDFLDDFLKQGVRSSRINGKQILRYSFDVRA